MDNLLVVIIIISLIILLVVFNNKKEKFMSYFPIIEVNPTNILPVCSSIKNKNICNNTTGCKFTEKGCEDNDNIVVEVRENNLNYFPNVQDSSKTPSSRPNCPQLNNEAVCNKTPGCRYNNTGCINYYRDLQEPKKQWEKGDQMIVY
jgi:hypothetical protein